MNMTETARQRDFVDLATLLALERDGYRLLLSICTGQHGAFSRGGARTLVKVMARKQAVIDSIGQLEKQLASYTSDWRATLAALPATARREIQELVDEIGALLGQVLDNERLIAKSVSEERDRKAARIRDIGGAKTAVRAYEGTLAGSGRYLDRES